MLLACSALSVLPLPPLTEDDIGDWIDTEFGGVKLQELGDTSVVYRDDEGEWTFAHIIDDKVVEASNEHVGLSKNYVALLADAHYLSLQDSRRLVS